MAETDRYGPDFKANDSGGRKEKGERMITLTCFFFLDSHIWFRPKWEENRGENRDISASYYFALNIFDVQFYGLSRLKKEVKIWDYSSILQCYLFAMYLCFLLCFLPILGGTKCRKTKKKKQARESYSFCSSPKKLLIPVTGTSEKPGLSVCHSRRSPEHTTPNTSFSLLGKVFKLSFPHIIYIYMLVFIGVSTILRFGTKKSLLSFLQTFLSFVNYW